MAWRIRAYYERKYPLKVTDNLAADLGVCERQARNILRRGPSFTHFAHMVAREGQRFVEAVIHPAAGMRADTPRRRRIATLASSIGHKLQVVRGRA